jgi:TrmH family RNA methyltransferase
MLTNKQIKLINSLHSKKGRIDNQLFLVEGEKAVLEIIASNIPVNYVVTSDYFASKYEDIFKHTELYIENEEQLHKLSTLVTNAFGFAVVSMKHFTYKLTFDNQITVVLDGIRDPGNLGTIIRICDWYGISQLVMSTDCTDFFNPKVISASMGSYARIKIEYLQLESIFRLNPQIPVLGALLDGEDIHHVEFPDASFLLFGNESNGIRSENLKFIHKNITIPRYGLAESLNVGISTAIFLDNLRRN